MGLDVAGAGTLWDLRTISGNVARCQAMMIDFEARCSTKYLARGGTESDPDFVGFRCGEERDDLPLATKTWRSSIIYSRTSSASLGNKRQLYFKVKKYSTSQLACIILLPLVSTAMERYMSF